MGPGYGLWIKASAGFKIYGVAQAILKKFQVGPSRYKWSKKRKQGMVWCGDLHWATRLGRTKVIVNSDGDTRPYLPPQNTV